MYVWSLAILFPLAFHQLLHSVPFCLASPSALLQSLLILLDKVFHGLGLWFTSNELSTPSLNLSWLFAVLEKKLADSKSKSLETLKRFNLILLVLTFFGSRVIANTYATYRSLNDIYFHPRAGGGKHIFSARLVAALTPLMSALNYYWFLLITQKMIRYVSHMK